MLSPLSLSGPCRRIGLTRRSVVCRSFWHQFQEFGLGGSSTYSVGEVLVSDLWEGYDASYQLATGREGYTGPLLGGVLNCERSPARGDSAL